MTATPSFSSSAHAGLTPAQDIDVAKLCREFLKCTIEEAKLPTIKCCSLLMARVAINSHTIADDDNYGESPGEHCLAAAQIVLAFESFTGCQACIQLWLWLMLARDQLVGF